MKQQEKDILYLAYCGYKPEEVTWEYRDSQRYKTFMAGMDAMQETMNKQGLALQSDMDSTIAQNFALKSRITEMETDLINTKAALKEEIAKERDKEIKSEEQEKKLKPTWRYPLSPVHICKFCEEPDENGVISPLCNEF